jgi:hypothetical protein
MRITHKILRSIVTTYGGHPFETILVIILFAIALWIRLGWKGTDRGKMSNWTKRRLARNASVEFPRRMKEICDETERLNRVAPNNEEVKTRLAEVHAAVAESFRLQIAGQIDGAIEVLCQAYTALDAAWDSVTTAERLGYT